MKLLIYTHVLVFPQKNIVAENRNQALLYMGYKFVKI